MELFLHPWKGFIEENEYNELEQIRLRIETNSNIKKYKFCGKITEIEIYNEYKVYLDEPICERHEYCREYEDWCDEYKDEYFKRKKERNSIHSTCYNNIAKACKEDTILIKQHKTTINGKLESGLGFIHPNLEKIFENIIK